MMKTVASNIWKLNVFRFFREFWIIVPVLIPFYKFNQITTFEIFLIQAIFGLAVIFCEVPSGYLADKIGRKITLMIGAIGLPLSLLFYVKSSSFANFLVAEVTLAISFSMISGTDSALIYDTLLQDKREGLYHKFEGNAEFYARIGCGLSGIAGGLIGAYFLKLPFYINIVTGLIMFFTTTTIVEPFVHKSSERGMGILSVVKYCLTHREIVIIMAVYGVIFATGLTTIWGYLLKLNITTDNIVIYGLMFSLLQVSSAVAARNSAFLTNILGDKSILFVLFIPLIFLLIGIFSNLLVVLVLIISHAFLWGSSSPFLLSKLNVLIESEIRATVISTMNMVGRLFYVLISPLFGYLLQNISYQSGFSFLAIVTFALLVVPTILISKSVMTQG